MTNTQMGGVTLPRRWFLGGATALAAAPLVLPQIAEATETGSGEIGRKIIDRFAKLPGDVSIKIVASPRHSRRGLHVNLEPTRGWRSPGRDATPSQHRLAQHPTSEVLDLAQLVEADNRRRHERRPCAFRGIAKVARRQGGGDLADLGRGGQR
jgi:hypothetical protein